MIDIEMAELRGRLGGDLALPGDPGWESARVAWNLRVDQRPEAVVEAADAGDVREAVAFAARNGLRVAPQATGHGAGSLGPLEGALLLRLARLRGIEVWPEERVARIEAGVQAAELADAAGAHGLAPCGGLAATVGVTGLTLSGGVGWLGRTRGLSCNNVCAIEAVTAAGEPVRADADNEPELFWALRGGAPLAVVTAVELELHPVPELFAGTIAWPAERAPELYEVYRNLAAAAPEALSTLLRYVDVPDLPFVPEPLRGRRVMMLVVAHLGPEADGADLIAPARALGDPIFDTCAPAPPAALARIAGDPEEPAPFVGDGLLLDGLPAELAALLGERITGGAMAPLVAVDVRQLGGALARPPEGHGALARLDGAFALFATGITPTPEVRGLVEGRLAELREAVLPWTAPQVLLSFRDLPSDPATGFDPETWERLRRARAGYDPDGLVLSSRPVPPPD